MTALKLCIRKKDGGEGEEREDEGEGTILTSKSNAPNYPGHGSGKAQPVT